MKSKILLISILLILCVATSFLSAGSQIIKTGTEYISSIAMSQRALFNYLVRQRSQDYNKATTSAGLVLTTGTQIQVKNDVHFMIDGLFHKLPATDTPSFESDAQASGTRRIYLLSVNAAGTATCTAGSAVVAALTPLDPNPPALHIPFGRINLLANAPFTLGTTNLTSATAIAQNLSRMNPLGDENFQDL